MKSTYSITQAQANLPKIVSADRVIGISKHNVVQGFYIPRERFEALLETMEILANPKARAAIKRYESGKMKFKPLSELEKELD